MNDADRKRPSARRILFSVAKLLLAGLVLYAAGRQISDTLAETRHHRLALSVPWLAVAAALYAAGMSMFGAYWTVIVGEMGGKLPLAVGLRTYMISQLGKYAPGKAWVVVIRCVLAGESGTPAGVAAASTFYETLAQMGVASLIALIALAALALDWRVLLLALGLAVGLLATVQPPIFTRLVSLAALPFKRTGAEVAKPITYAGAVRGAHLLVLGWILLGLSVAAAGAGVGVDLFSGSRLALAVGGIALSTAFGFVLIFLPAGLGAREWLLMKTLGAAIGPAAAMVALAARLVNVVAELVVGGALYLLVRRAKTDG